MHEDLGTCEAQLRRIMCGERDCRPQHGLRARRCCSRSSDAGCAAAEGSSGKTEAGAAMPMNNAVTAGLTVLD